MNRTLASLLAQRRLCVGPNGNGDREHSKRRKRCARGATVSRNRID